MAKTQTQENNMAMANIPPPGYPMESPPSSAEKKKKGWFRIFRSNKSRGDDKGCIEG
ncbi:hypothetical protein Dimus_002141, partial [Dionaea muscipula]